MNITNIKPCPLCGGRAELSRRLGDSWPQVICCVCGCRTGETRKLSAAEVIDQWNTRAALKEQTR